LYAKRFYVFLHGYKLVVLILFLSKNTITQ